MAETFKPLRNHGVENETISLTGILEKFWRRKWYVALCVVASIGLGMTYSQHAQPVYRIRARLLVRQQGLPLETRTASRPDRGFLATQAEILRSPAVVEAAVAGTSAANEDVKPPVARVLKGLSVEPIKGTDVLTVSLTGHDSQAARRDLEAIIASYRDYIRDIDRGSHLEALRLLTRNERQLREELERREANYLQLRESNFVAGQGTEAARAVRESLDSLVKQLNEAKNRRLALDNQLRTFGQLRSSSLASTTERLSELVELQPIPTASLDEADTAASPVAAASFSADPLGELATIPVAAWSGLKGVADIDAVQLQLFKTQMQEKELAQIYGEKHPMISAVREQIAGWEFRLRQYLLAAPLILEQEVQAIRRQEEQLVALHAEELERAKLLDLWELKEQHAVDQIKRIQTNYQATQKQLREWQLTDEAMADGRSRVSVTVLAPPSGASRAIWPATVPLLGICTSLGLTLGTLLVAVLERPSRVVVRNEVADARGVASARAPAAESVPAEALDRGRNDSLKSVSTATAIG